MGEIPTIKMPVFVMVTMAHAARRLQRTHPYPAILPWREPRDRGSGGDGTHNKDRKAEGDGGGKQQAVRKKSDGGGEGGCGKAIEE